MMELENQKMVTVSLYNTPHSHVVLLNFNDLVCKNSSICIHKKKTQQPFNNFINVHNLLQLLLKLHPY